MFDGLVELFKEALQHLDYFWVTVLMTIESSFIPFPSEVVVPPAAYRAANGDLNVFWVVFFATLGSDLGAIINYFLARYLGRPIVYRFAESKLGKMCLLSKEKVSKAEGYFDKNGASSTLVGRLIPGIRQLISIPAGLARMSIGKFLFYTTLGAAAWNSILAGLGYYFGKVVPEEELVPTVAKYSKMLGLVITLCVVLFLIYRYVKSKRCVKSK